MCIFVVGMQSVNPCYEPSFLSNFDDELMR